MTDISTQSFSWGVRSGLWLASAHGVNCNDSYTLLVSSALEAEHYPDGYLKDGTPLAEVSATPGIFKVWDAGASDGAENLVGFAYDCPVIKNADGTNKTHVGGAITVHGFVVLSQLPRGFVDKGVDDTLVAVTATDLPPLISARRAQDY
jgi:hypothetical protein